MRERMLGEVAIVGVIPASRAWYHITPLEHHHRIVYSQLRLLDCKQIYQNSPNATTKDSFYLFDISAITFLDLCSDSLGIKPLKP